MRRRTFLTGVGGLAAAGMAGSLATDWHERGWRAPVVIAGAASYQGDLETTIRDGLTELGFGPARIRGKSILLKPNLVEPCVDAPQINTHPAVVRAAAEVFRGWGAGEVFIAEGPGHCRDAQLVLEQSGMESVLAESRLEFVDLNLDEVILIPNRYRWTSLPHLVLPATLTRADVIVSIPKMKTHHWAGVTLSMKNLFGVLPGIYYGWPKNVLHHAGIGRSILDITAAVRPHLAIVDGIIGMEGDGPIMGTPKHAGVLVMGTNLPAVDATATRLMGINPHRIEHLAGASGRLGPIVESHIEQRGETIAGRVQPFRLLDHPAFANLRA
ncbi:MAG: DUF362 domain-containing protein [Isosphaeraceae bacterium]